MTTGVHVWSKTASSNGSADTSINFAEGQAPSTVNDSARAVMARVAEYRDDNAGSLTTGGSSTAYTLTTNTVFTTLALLSGQRLKVRFNATNGASPTLNVDGLGAKAIQAASGTAVGTGVIAANSVWDVTYDNSIPAFLLSGVPAQIQDATVATTSIVAKAVSYAKIQDISATSRLLGRASSGSGVTEEITVGSGLAITGTTISAPAFPGAGLHVNKVITVASNTTVTVTADALTVTDGAGNYKTVAVSSTVNLGTTGVDALIGGSGANGTITIDTSYHLYGITKADGTTKVVACTSSTPDSTFLTALANIASGAYTFYAHMGAVQTIHSSAILYGTKQVGRRTSYVVGLAQTTTARRMVNGSSGAIDGSSWTPIALSGYVPTTASKVIVAVHCGSAGQTVIVAPNNSYGGYTSTTNPPPVAISLGTGAGANTVTAELLLESTNIYWASDSTNGSVFCLGWEENT